MTHSYRQRVRCVEMLRINFYAKGFLHHSAYLLLRGGAVSAYRYLGFSGGVFGNLDAVGGGCDHRSSLRPAQFEDDLGVLIKEGRFYRHMVGLEAFAQPAYKLVYTSQFYVRIGFLTDIEHAHLDVLWFVVLANTDDPETKQVSSGIYSEYGSYLSQSCRSLYTGAEPRG